MSTRTPLYDLILAAEANLEAKSGDNLTFKATFTESTGGAWDLVQYDTIVFTVKRRLTDSAALITADLATGLSVENVNTLDFNILGTTMDVIGGDYFYEVVAEAVGVTETLMQGRFFLRN